MERECGRGTGGEGGVGVWGCVEGCGGRVGVAGACPGSPSGGGSFGAPPNAGGRGPQVLRPVSPLHDRLS